MKIMLSLLLLTFFTACNNAGKDSVESADSANRAIQDSALNNNGIVIDEASSSFLVRVANSGMAEVEMASIARQKASYQQVKDFAAMLHHDHSGVNEQVKNLAAQKNIILPDTVSADKRKIINDLEQKTGKDFDREFIKIMISNHETSIGLFEDAMLDTKDQDVRSFADKTLPALKNHLDSAKSIQKKYL